MRLPSPTASADIFAEQFELLLKSCRIVPDAVAIIDRDHRFVHANDRMAAVSGTSIEAVVGRTIYDADPRSALVLAPLVVQTLADGTPRLKEPRKVPVLSEEGEPARSFHWLVSCYPLKSLDGKVHGVGTVIKDVTDQKRKESRDRRLDFEELLASLSATFINVAINEVDRKIEQGLQRLVEFLGFERSTIWRVAPGEWRLLRTHSYSLPGIMDPPGELDDSVIPVWGEMVRTGKTFAVHNVDELPDSHWQEKAYCRARGGIKSIMFIPVSVGGSIVGLISFVSYRVNRDWPDDLTQRLRVLWEIFANALERKHADEAIHRALSEIEQLKNRLEAENLYLRDQIEIEHPFEDIIGNSRAIRQALLKIEQVAGADSTVLVLGETGTGKELAARAIHNMSGRKGRTMIKVNCGALPATLIEAELFGREKGAYTGATTSQIGRFEAADGSTLFLDEIGELPLELQSKLLRVLQDGEFERLGNPKPIKVNVRVVAATNRDLTRAIKEGSFREDLYYRLNVFPVSVPPLRERREDIPLLVWAIVNEFSKIFGKTIESIPKKNMDALMRYQWPGNIRELRNMVERAMILNNGRTLYIELPEHPVEKGTLMKSLEEIERLHILAVLEYTGCRIRGKGGAAEILDVIPTTLEAKMRKLAIKRQSVATAKE